MTNEEIIKVFQEADKLLQQYKETIRPAAAELARQKSIAVFGKEGYYSGDLGCVEEGVENVCLHIQDRSTQLGMTPARRRLAESVASSFEDAWGERLRLANVRGIFIMGAEW